MFEMWKKLYKLAYIYELAVMLYDTKKLKQIDFNYDTYEIH
jgi:hypothetical protein